MRTSSIIAILLVIGTVAAFAMSDMEEQKTYSWRYKMIVTVETPEGDISGYADLPVGTTGTLNPNNPPGYPKLVTFKDITDPKSVALAQEWTKNDMGNWEDFALVTRPLQ